MESLPPGLTPDFFHMSRKCQACLFRPLILGFSVSYSLILIGPAHHSTPLPLRLWDGWQFQPPLGSAPLISPAQRSTQFLFPTKLFSLPKPCVSASLGISWWSYLKYRWLGPSWRFFLVLSLGGAPGICILIYSFSDFGAGGLWTKYWETLPKFCFILLIYKIMKYFNHTEKQNE